MAEDDEFTFWRTDSREVRQYAKALRRDMTPMERVLWNAIRNRQVGGIKSHQQVPYGHFILDFYAPELKLVVEVDCVVHDLPEQRAYDLRREQWLLGEGLHVFRVTNSDVGTNVDEVRESIRLLGEQLRQRIG